MKTRSFTCPTSTRARCRAATTATASAKIERDAEILREVIERAEREDAERRRRTDDAGRDAADGAVAAAGDDDGDARAGVSSGVRRVLARAQLR